MPVNYSQLMNIKTGLDILSFPWKPGDVLDWFCYQALMYVLVHKLLCLLRAYCMVIITVACSNSLMKAELMEVELLDAEPSLFLLYLDEKENVQDVLEDQTASADNLTVLMTLLSQAEVNFQGETILTVLLRLKLFPQDQPTLPVKGGAPNPYLVYLLPEDCVLLLAIGAVNRV